jgi:hypothetical protein
LKYLKELSDNTSFQIIIEGLNFTHAFCFVLGYFLYFKFNLSIAGNVNHDPNNDGEESNAPNP